jgi:hypothetical protein
LYPHKDIAVPFSETDRVVEELIQGKVLTTTRHLDQQVTNYRKIAIVNPELSIAKQFKNIEFDEIIKSGPNTDPDFYFRLMHERIKSHQVFLGGFSVLNGVGSLSNYAGNSYILPWLTDTAPILAQEELKGNSIPGFDLIMHPDRFYRRLKEVQYLFGTEINPNSGLGLN